MPKIAEDCRFVLRTGSRLGYPKFEDAMEVLGHKPEDVYQYLKFDPQIVVESYYVYLKVKELKCNVA